MSRVVGSAAGRAVIVIGTDLSIATLQILIRTLGTGQTSVHHVLESRRMVALPAALDPRIHPVVGGAAVAVRAAT